VAPGGVGKSSLAIVELLAIATGRPLLGRMPDESCPVWYWNGEDPMDELNRRIMAACLHYKIRPEELEGRFFVNSGRTTPIVIAEKTRDGVTIHKPVIDQIMEPHCRGLRGLYGPHAPCQEDQWGRGDGRGRARGCGATVGGQGCQGHQPYDA
jgi:hypothetical protein